MLRSITPAVARAHGMFTHLHHALQQARGRQVLLSTAVKDELSACIQIIHELANIPTHLCNIDHSPPKWEGATYTSGTGMGGICKDL